MNCVIQSSDCRVALQGDVTMASVKEVPVLPVSSGECWCVDLSDVDESDSVLIAILCGFERQLSQAHASFEIVAMPEKMVNLTALYGLTERLGL